MVAVAQYPTNVWDGRTPTRDLDLYRPAEEADFDQIREEIKAVESQLLAAPWNIITLSGSWTHTVQAVPAWKKIGNHVHLKGVIEAGTLTDATTIFTLPSGSRPTTTLTFLVASSIGDTADAGAKIYIASDGTAKVHGMSTMVSIDLSNINFFTDQ